MVKIKSLHYKLPKSLEKNIFRCLKAFDLKFDQDPSRGFSFDSKSAKYIAACVQKLSDFYIQFPEQKTPWADPSTQIAYLCYYMPLNMLRFQYVVEQAHKALEGVDSFLEFGSGLGASSQVLSDIYKEARFFCVEKSELATKLHRQLVNDNTEQYQWGSSYEYEVNFQCGVFSYVLTELPKVPKFLFKMESLIIVEPSTKEDGRKLQRLRGQLIEKGYNILAPCTHMLPCPLLSHSKTDWCHQKIEFSPPGWFLQIEKHLPIKNQELSFSYLVATRKNIEKPEAVARVVGDPLISKGKQKQMLCRGEDREFISWLTKRHTAQDFHRGDILEVPATIEKRGDELRPGSNKIKIR